MKKYRLIEDANIIEFEKKVNEALIEGWEFQGNVACSSHHQPEICPPMVFTYCQGMTERSYHDDSIRNQG